MRLLQRSLRYALWVGLGLTGVLVVPAGCIFPDYTFNEPEPSGSGGASTTTGTTMTSSSGGGGTTANTGGSSSTGMMNPENCTNGIDDDNDGKTDCEDPKCVDYQCVADVPTGWEGFYSLYDGVGPDPGCPSTFPTATLPPYQADLTVPPATCSCTCGVATGQTCAALDTIKLLTRDAACAANAKCTGPSLAVPMGWDGSCYGPNYYPGGRTTCGPGTDSMCSTETGNPCNVSVTSSALAATGGSCMPSQVQVMKPDLVWARFGRACGTDPMANGKGCNIGQTCVPKPQLPYVTGLCIYKQGDNACPAGAFKQKHLFYEGASDTRDCTNDCSCSPPSGGTCPTTIAIYSDTGGVCNTKVAEFQAGSCADVAGNPNLAGRTASAPGAPTGATCAPSGGQPTGTATPDLPVTFCCAP